MSDLSDWNASLERAVAPLGQFSTTYPDATEDDVTAALSDGLAEAQLDGFFTTAFDSTTYTVDPDTGIVTPDITQAQAALVIIYAAVRLISARLLNLQTMVRYQAGAVSYETQMASNVLTTLLKQFQARIDLLREKALYSGVNAAFHMADGYFLAATERYLFPGDPFPEGWPNNPNFG